MEAPVAGIDVSKDKLTVL